MPYINRTSTRYISYSGQLFCILPMKFHEIFALYNIFVTYKKINYIIFLFFSVTTKISWNQNIKQIKYYLDLLFCTFPYREEKKEIERRKIIHDRSLKMKQHLPPNHDGQNQSELLWKLNYYTYIHTRSPLKWSVRFNSMNQHLLLPKSGNLWRLLNFYLLHW